MPIQVSIQEIDYSIHELGTMSSEDALKTIHDFNWLSKLDELTERVAKGEDCCMAGILLTRQDDGVLHMTAIAENQYMIYINYETVKPQKKLFGLFPLGPRGTFHRESQSLESFDPLLEQFMMLPPETFIEQAENGMI